MLSKNRDFKIRPADKEDLPRILQIYEYARKFMKETGNASQWKDSFPPERLLAEATRHLKKGPPPDGPQVPSRSHRSHFRRENRHEESRG